MNYPAYTHYIIQIDDKAAWSEIAPNYTIVEEIYPNTNIYEIKKVYEAAITAGWDGEWFVRAYDAYSHKVGSKECEEGQIYIEPQGMCVMAGVGVEDGNAETNKLLNQILNKLK